MRYIYLETQCLFTRICVFLVAAPTVNIRALENQTVGQSLMLQCDVIITDDGNTRSVNIVWSGDDTVLERMDVLFPTSVGNSAVYTHRYTTPQLTTSDDGRVIQCEANVTEVTSVLYRSNITLDVIGEYMRTICNIIIHFVCAFTPVIYM